MPTPAVAGWEPADAGGGLPAGAGGAGLASGDPAPAPAASVPLAAAGVAAVVMFCNTITSKSALS